jgi:hypothetical protein
MAALLFTEIFLYLPWGKEDKDLAREAISITENCGLGVDHELFSCT